MSSTACPALSEKHSMLRMWSLSTEQWLQRCVWSKNNEMLCHPCPGRLTARHWPLKIETEDSPSQWDGGQVSQTDSFAYWRNFSSIKVNGNLSLKPQASWLMDINLQVDTPHHSKGWEKQVDFCLSLQGASCTLSLHHLFFFESEVFHGSYFHEKVSNCSLPCMNSSIYSSTNVLPFELKFSVYKAWKALQAAVGLSWANSLDCILAFFSTLRIFLGFLPSLSCIQQEFLMLYLDFKIVFQWEDFPGYFVWVMARN